MTRLLRDRYYAYGPEHAWDLATGESVGISELPDETGGDLPALVQLREVLDHGEEGRPRWIVATAASGSRARRVVRHAAADASARGFVPVGADVYLRLREVLVEELRGRALLLIARRSVSGEIARRALVDAASRSPRPHVLLTFRSSPTDVGAAQNLDVGAAFRRPASLQYAPPVRGEGVVREARAVYGLPAIRPRTPVPPPDDVVRHIARGTRAIEFAGAGRHAAAERLLRDVAAALVRRRAFAAAADASVTLGRLLMERGRAVDADATFEQAAEHASVGGDEAASLSARIWQAAARTDALQLTGAEALCRAVLLAGTLSGAERSRAEATLARILIWQGRVDAAAALALDDTSTDSDSWGFVTATAVRVLLAQGDVFRAGLRARQLMANTDSSEASLARVIALSAYIRVLVTMGDLVAAEEAALALQQATRAARVPLRLARMRLLLVDAFRRAGRTHDADHVLDYLKRVQPVAPPLLRDAIDRRIRGTGPCGPDCATRALAVPTLAVAIATIAQGEDDDRCAIQRTINQVAERLKTSRVELCSADAGPVAAVLGAGSGLATRLGARVLEAGIVIASRADDAGSELGVPVRLGSRLIAAIVARWPVDRQPPADAREILEVVAAIAAPRIDAMQAAAREVAQSASVVAGLIGSSAGIAEVRRAIVRAAPAPFSVLIEGESGVGKELVARAIHQLSPRRERRFCDVNGAALPDDLLESELFGHARGAFTGAVAERAGLVEEADGGTLFLDEVSELSPRAQAKLLRVLQQQEVRRVGETFSRKVDIRVVCAANRGLRERVAGGHFREDLLYRLDVIQIRVPPLRDRPEDVPALTDCFWRAAAQRVGTRATLAHDVMTALARYHWPGNVRELQNVMAALAVAAPSRGRVRSTLLPSAITGAAVITSPRLADARDQFERRFIEAALARAGGSRARAARELGISRQGLLKMMARLGVRAASSASR